MYFVEFTNVRLKISEITRPTTLKDQDFIVPISLLKYLNSIFIR
jgi:DNA polymerase III sliding clamp (beta) subunit (PCNA family)